MSYLNLKNLSTQIQPNSTSLNPNNQIMKELVYLVIGTSSSFRPAVRQANHVQRQMYYNGPQTSKISYLASTGAALMQLDVTAS